MGSHKLPSDLSTHAPTPWYTVMCAHTRTQIHFKKERLKQIDSFRLKDWAGHLIFFFSLFIPLPSLYRVDI